MRVSVILAHPDEQSFNHAIACTAVEASARNGCKVFFHDLYAEKFDPILPAMEIPQDGQIAPSIEQHCREITHADGIIIVHPNWWGQPPAILKGWIDRIIRPGVAYRFLEGDQGEGIPIGLLKAKAALVFNTSNTLPEREAKAFGDPLEKLRLWIVWDQYLLPRNIFRHCDQHTRAKADMAQKSRRNRGGIFSANRPASDC